MKLYICGTPCLCCRASYCIYSHCKHSYLAYIVSTNTMCKCCYLNLTRNCVGITKLQPSFSKIPIMTDEHFFLTPPAIYARLHDQNQSMITNYHEVKIVINLLTVGLFPCSSFVAFHASFSLNFLPQTVMKPLNCTQYSTKIT